MAGCAATGTGAGAGPATVVQGTPPWALPPSTVGSRHLFRLSYRGPEGSGGLKIALFLSSSRDFTARIFDRLGREVWSARSRNGETLWVDHRRELFCRTRGPVAWAGLEDLGALPPGALPALLLHRVPLGPAEAERRSGSVIWDGPRFSFRDRRGRRWSGRVDGTDLASWSLRDEGRPVWWWSRGDEGEGLLSQRGAGRQLRWRRLASEPLESRPPDVEIPGEYRECPAAVPSKGSLSRPGDEGR